MPRAKKDSEIDLKTAVNATNELDPTLQVADAVSRAITGFNVDTVKNGHSVLTGTLQIQTLKHSLTNISFQSLMRQLLLTWHLATDSIG